MAESPGPAHAQAQRWLRWAGEDLVAARHSAADAEIASRVACGLAQQAAEKAIKALLVAADLDPPKTHNLLRLARMPHRGDRQPSLRFGPRGPDPMGHRGALPRATSTMRLTKGSGGENAHPQASADRNGD